MAKTKKWLRVELPEVAPTEVSGAFEDAIAMQGGCGDPETFDERRASLRSLKSRVLRVIRAVRGGRVYRKKRR